VIDRETRASLAIDLRRLVTGRMTNDDFDDCYFETYEASKDRAVHAISSFGYGLYSSGVETYRLRRWYAVDAETKARAARCLLFLRRENEYEWPPWPDNRQWSGFQMAALYLGMAAGVVIVLLGVSDPVFGVVFVVFGLALAIASIWVQFWTPAAVRETHAEFQRVGDYDVWPFLKRAEFDAARRIEGAPLKPYKKGAL
jgi:hypothetical protein